MWPHLSFSSNGFWQVDVVRAAQAAAVRHAHSCGFRRLVAAIGDHSLSLVAYGKDARGRCEAGVSWQCSVLARRHAHKFCIVLHPKGCKASHRKPLPGWKNRANSTIQNSFNYVLQLISERHAIIIGCETLLENSMTSGSGTPTWQPKARVPTGKSKACSLPMGATICTWPTDSSALG